MPTATLAPKLVPGAIYQSDNGRLICAKCAGATALYTGRDLSGQPVERLDVDDVRDWKLALGRLPACERGCTTIGALVGPDGWPAVVTP